MSDDDSDDQLRALTVKQPLAWAIVQGHKPVENRSWRFPYPMGTTIAIHAGKKLVDRMPVDIDVPDDIPRGAVVGFADVVDQHHSSECQREHEAFGEPAPVSYCSPWAYGDHHHWLLANPRVIEQPEPTRGYLWLFIPPPEVTARLLAALRG